MIIEPLRGGAAQHVFASQKLFADDTPLPGARPGPGPDQDRPALGLCRSMTGPGTAAPPPAVVYSTPGPSRAEHPAAHLAAVQDVSCRWTATPGSRACWRTGRRVKSGWPSAGPIAEGASSMRSTRRPALLSLAEEALRRIGSSTAIEAEIRGRPAEERRRAGRSGASRCRWTGPCSLAHGPAGAGLGPRRPG